jgi:hypothetical protein
MIHELCALLAAFPGAENRTRCFAHIINLIAKTIIQQFDVPKAREGEIVDEALRELRALAGDIDIEELLMKAGAAKDDDNNEEDDDDNEEGWVDERGEMSEFEAEELAVDVQPVRTMLVKVCLRCPSRQCKLSNVLLTNGRFSSAKQHTQSRTQRRSSSQSGSPHLTNSSSMNA